VNAQKVVSDSNEMLEGHKCTARKSLRTIVECHKVSSVRLRPSGTAFVTVTTFWQSRISRYGAKRRMPKGLNRHFCKKIDNYNNNMSVIISFLWS
jgi:hypothetical protein